MSVSYGMERELGESAPDNSLVIPVCKVHLDLSMRPTGLITTGIRQLKLIEVIHFLEAKRIRWAHVGGLRYHLSLNLPLISRPL